MSAPALASPRPGLVTPARAALAVAVLGAATILGALFIQHVLGVQPAECVFVGDRLWDDILGSQQAGMRAILIPHSVLPSIQVPDDSAVPDAVAQRLSDVLTIVRAWHDGAPSTA